MGLSAVHLAVLREIEAADCGDHVADYLPDWTTENHLAQPLCQQNADWHGHGRESRVELLREDGHLKNKSNKEEDNFEIIKKRNRTCTTTKSEMSETEAKRIRLPDKVSGAISIRMHCQESSNRLLYLY